MRIVIPGIASDGCINGRAVLRKAKGSRRFTIGKSDEYTSYMDRVALAAKQQMVRDGPPCFEAMLGVSMWVFHPKARRPDSLPGIPRDVVPNLDVDSVVKAVLDGLQQAGVYDDDARIMTLEVNKRLDREDPRVEVEVFELRYKSVTGD